MQEEFKSAAWSDFKARYQNTFGWYEKATGQKILVELVEVREEELHFRDVRGIGYTATADNGNIFTFIPVERSLYNVGPEVWYCTRHPARQWKRGLCHSNTRFFTLPQSARDVNIENVNKIFQDKPDVRMLWEQYQRCERNGVAISPTFAFVNNDVFLYDRRIGTIKEKEITLLSGLFKQELGDVMQRLNIDCTIGLK